jgi:hypothetical protein
MNAPLVALIEVGLVFCSVSQSGMQSVPMSRIAAIGGPVLCAI